LYEIAPEGQFITVLMIWSVGAPFMSIHGRFLGSKTTLSEAKHLAECRHILGFQKTVISPFEYFRVRFGSVLSVMCF
jgi:hypothetical protein